MSNLPTAVINGGERPQWTLTLPSHIYHDLRAHLFPGDGDEHGAIMVAGVQRRPEGLRLLARDVVLARDGIDFVPGTRGYRMLTGEFITKQIIRSRDGELAYLAIHNHSGDDSVAFSRDDLASQQRGYPALLDIANGPPVGALVFAKNAIAGRLWLSHKRQVDLASARIPGPSFNHLFPKPPSKSMGCAEEYDRQSRIFGDRGQDLLSNLTVGVIGAGGVGSLVVELLARLGVGRFVIADPDFLEVTNVPGVTGSTKWDAMACLTSAGRPEWLRRLGRCLASPKVKIMNRIIHRANPKAQVATIEGNFADDHVARRFLGCDYLFNAADSYQARLVFNAIVHAYLIPGVDLGAKVPVDRHTGEVGEVRSVVHPVSPSKGCLLCNGFVPPGRLQQEMETPPERKHQRYVEDENVFAPSVITLNAIAASHAVNDFLFSVTGLTYEDMRTEYLRILPRSRRMVFEAPRKDPSCPHCGIGDHSLFARGDKANLPTRERKSEAKGSAAAWLKRFASLNGARSGRVKLNFQ